MKRLLFLILILAGSIVLASCSAESTAQTTSAEPARELPADVRSVQAIVAASPAPGSTASGTNATVVESALSATGEFVSPSRSEVAPKIPGRVASVSVDEGARVARGQVLFSLETDYLRLDLQRAEAELARASAVLAEAQRDFDRKKELRGKDSIPQATFDRSQAGFEQARAARAGSASAVGMARQRLNDATVRSPFSGVVAERRVDVGEHLADGGIAYVILQTAPLKLRFQVPEKYLARVRPGTSVVATVDPYPGEKFEGTIKTVGGVIDPATRTLFAEAEFANADGRLRPGLFARVNVGLN
jgi:membrane fusion protein (multidrug efflux system)